MYKKPQFRFKTYKSDAAPFFFYIEIFPFDTSLFTNPYTSILIKAIERNPIVPLPMRIDRVFNGESSVIIRPSEPISFQISEDQIATINPYQFLINGIKNLIYFSEIRSAEQLYKRLQKKDVISWWEATKFLYGNLLRLEEDFSAFLKAYLHTMVKNYVGEDDLVNAAIKYCRIIENICNTRLEQNKIITEVDGVQSIEKMYKVKDRSYYKKFKKVSATEFHPELIDIELYDYSENNWPNNIASKNGLEKTIKKYIPLLFYDDLQECMLMNLKYLEENEKEILNPSILIEENIISIIDSKGFDDKFQNNITWSSEFKDININMLLDEMHELYSK